MEHCIRCFLYEVVWCICLTRNKKTGLRICMDYYFDDWIPFVSVSLKVKSNEIKCVVWVPELLVLFSLPWFMPYDRKRQTWLPVSFEIPTVLILWKQMFILGVYFPLLLNSVNEESPCPSDFELIAVQLCFIYGNDFHLEFGIQQTELTGTNHNSMEEKESSKKRWK